MSDIYIVYRRLQGNQNSSSLQLKWRTDWQWH